MKVSISVGGRFHAFYLAKSLQEAGYLHKLVTSYPKFEVKRYGIKSNKISTVVSKEIIERTWKKITKKPLSNIFMCNWYDKLAAYQIPIDSDVYIIWSGFALHTIHKIKKQNPRAIIILERGSAHIAEQAKLLEKSIKKSVIEQAIIDKEIAEYQIVDIISTISLFAQKSFIANDFLVNKIFVNNMGVDLQEFPFYNRKLKRQNESFVVGYAGIMSARKNVKGLINAVNILVEQGLNIQLLLVGGIDNTSFDENLLKQTFVDYRSSYPQNKLHEAYKQMDLFVINSIEDGFGMVILQAMATGLPIIGTTNTGAPDVVQNDYSGFIIPIDDDKILAEKIAYLYHNREKCLEMGINANKTTQNGFSWEDYGNRYIKFLESIVKK
jgi:glycosyltransferase involved in cell wall biosynthesis